MEEVNNLKAPFSEVQLKAALAACLATLKSLKALCSEGLSRKLESKLLACFSLNPAVLALQTHHNSHCLERIPQKTQRPAHKLSRAYLDPLQFRAQDFLGEANLQTVRVGYLDNLNNQQADFLVINNHKLSSKVLHCFKRLKPKLKAAYLEEEQELNSQLKEADSSGNSLLHLGSNQHRAFLEEEGRSNNRKLRSLANSNPNSSLLAAFLSKTYRYSNQTLKAS